MKYIKSIFILCIILAASSTDVAAQDTAWVEADSLTVGQEHAVQVAFRKVAEKDLLGGVSVVDLEGLTEKNYNTYSLDNMQGYVGGWNGNSLWGQDANNAGYLVLVDGVPRDASNVMPYEIAQITFLKGAQAVVLYGSRAAKGAVLITTKRGHEDGITVSVRANTGFNVAKSYPEYLGSAEYMTLYNEARVNDGNTPLYSVEDIYYHAAGSNPNPYRYTNINYYSSDYLKKYYNRSDASVEIQGGGKRAHFYSNVGYYRNGDYLNFGPAKQNMDDRFNVRGNVDVNINSFITAFINANATFYNQKRAKGDFWNAAANNRPNFPQGAAPLIPLDMIDPNATDAWELVRTSGNIIDGKYFLAGSQQDATNPFADCYAGGSSKWTSRQFQFDAGVNFDLDRVLKGLSFNAMFAMDYATSYSTTFDNEYAIFIPEWSNYSGKEVIVGLTKQNNDKKPGTQNIGGSTDNQTIAFNAQFNYDNTFDNAHNVSAMLIANGWQRTLSGQYHRVSNANLALQAGYNYRQRYYADFNGALVHSAKFAKGHREAFSPSLTLGWRISEEPFLQESGVLDDLILSVSGSIVNQDIDISMNGREYYLYESVWTQDYGYSWFDGALDKYTYATSGQNYDLTFIKRKELSANLRMSLLNRMITADASFFLTSMEGYLIDRPTFFPSHLITYYPDGGFLPVMNYNNRQIMGVDFAVNFNKQFGDFGLTVGVAGTYYDTKNTRVDEVFDTDQNYRYRQGRPVDGIWGLQSAGFFRDQDDIDNSPKQNFGSTVRPGDIKYVDQNGDGVVDEKDEVFLGKGGWYGSPFTLGLNITARYKGFTLFILGTGGFGGYGIKDSSYYWCGQGTNKYSAVVRNRWTPETADTATYPRLSAANNGNNFRTSDFWLYKTDRFDLAKVQLTYDLPKRLFAGQNVVSGFSVYVSGSNLLTISKERKHMEMTIAGAPQSRFYNLGVQLVF